MRTFLKKLNGMVKGFLKMYILSFVGTFSCNYLTIELDLEEKQSIFANFWKNLSFGPKSSLSCSLKYNKYSIFNVFQHHILCLSGCLFLCFYVYLSICINKRKHGWTDQTQIFCGTSHDPTEGLWMLKVTKKLCHKFFLFLVNLF